MQAEGIDGVAWRWLSGPGVGYGSAWNMAIDQAIFEAHLAGMGAPTIRVYDWEGPALTIGRLQDAEAARLAFPGMQWFRRPTGGRAVPHGEDLTISIIARAEFLSDRLAASGVLASYHLLVQAIVKAAGEYGTTLEAGGDSRGTNRSQDCFKHVAACDLVDRATGEKALGAAQLRRQGTILQQMSLLPLQNVEILSAEFQACLRHNFEKVLQIPDWRLESDLTQEEKQRAIQIVQSESSRREPANH